LNSSTPVVVLAPGYVGHGIARSLGRWRVPVYGVHGDARSPAARSRYWRENSIWQFDAATPAQSLDHLLQLGRRIGTMPLLVSTDDTTCLFVADHATELAGAFRFPQPPAGLARALSSKREMYHLCKRFSVSTPETVFPSSREDVVAYADTGDFPVMLKPIENRAAQRDPDKRMVVVRDAASLLRLYDAMETPNEPNLMLQEYIPGGPDTVWMFNGYFDSDSRCLFGMTGKKLRQYPPYTGVTSLGICLSNETVARTTTELMKAVGYQGILDIGYRYDARSGEYRLLDVNPRLGSTFRLFVDSIGMDVARAMYLDMSGQPVNAGHIKEGRKWVVENFDPVSSLTYYRDGRLSVADWVRSLRGLEEGSWLALDDPAPFAAITWRSVATAVKRFRQGRRPG
jgi:D-aspartate ligase